MSKVAPKEGFTAPSRKPALETKEVQNTI